MSTRYSPVLHQRMREVFDPACIYDEDLELDPVQAYAGMRVGVTGALYGIGGALTVELLRRGATVVGAYFRVEECVSKAVEALRRQGARCQLEEFDFRQVAEIERSAEWMVSTAGGIDCLFCVAGVTLRRPIGDTDVQQFADLHSVNVLAPMLQMKRALEVMKQNVADEYGVRGRLIGFSSPHAFGAMGYHSAYAASKAAVLAFVDQIAAESKAENWGLTAHAVIPGWVLTEQQVKAAMNGNPPLSRGEVIERFRAQAKDGAGATIANPRAFADTLLRLVRHTNFITMNSRLDLSAGSLTSFNNFTLKPESGSDFSDF